MKKELVASVVVLVVILGATAGYFIGASNTRITAITTITYTSTYSVGQAFLNVPKLYSDLGYPKIRHSDYSPYLPSKPNFTLSYQTRNMSFEVGTVQAPVININQALGLAAEKVGLDPSNYSLAYAAFYPGEIRNSTLVIHPAWYLFFARAYDGFWLFGSYGNGAFSAEASVDALNGTIRGTGIIPDLSNLPNSGRYELKVNSSTALETVRTSDFAGVPSALTVNGTVSFMEPRIVLLGPSSRNVAFQNPLNASLSGEKRLCWIIQLYSPTPRAGYQGTFAVDAETGKFVSGWAGSLFPSMHLETITGSIDFPTAKNLAVSQETFQINGSIIGRSGSVPVSVPDVLIVRPGSTATIELNFSSTITKDVNATLSFTNALPNSQNLSPNGFPRGVSFQFTRQAFVIPGNASATTGLLISAGESASSGTYLIELDAKLVSPERAQPGMIRVLFILSIWNGGGQWPSPPIMG